MKLAFVAVNFNNWHISSNYVSSIKSIREYNAHSITIIMVDNHSDEQDFLALSRELDGEADVLLVRTEKNLGYFGGLNYGISHIKTGDYDYVIAGNNDVFFGKDFLSVLCNKKYIDRFSLIVPDVETVNGIHQNPQFIDRPSKGRKLGYALYYFCYLFALLIDFLWMPAKKKRNNSRRKKIDTPMEIFLCTAVILIIRPRFFEKCGMLNDVLFLWGEEAALAKQLQDAGDAMYYDPDIRVMHLENSSVHKFTSYNKYKIWQKSYRIYKDYL